MLCLSRNVSEQVFIGSDISITVLSLRGRGVRLGIEAPHLPVNRKEILESRLQSGEVIPSLGQLVLELEQLRVENARLREQLAQCP